MRSVLLTVVLVAAVLALLPPFFTHGSCTAEFDAASRQFEAAKGDLATPARAQAYLQAHAVPYQRVDAPPCEPASPTDILSCPEGATLYAQVPVQNRICGFYRDDSIHIQLVFNHDHQLIRIQSDMKPFRTYRLALLDLELNWAK